MELTLFVDHDPYAHSVARSGVRARSTSIGRGHGEGDGVASEPSSIIDLRGSAAEAEPFHGKMIGVTRVARLVQALLLTAALLAATVVAAAEESEAQKRFTAWVTKLQKQHKLNVCRWGNLQFSPRYPGGFYAWLDTVGNGREGESWLLFEGKQGRFLYYKRSRPTDSFLPCYRTVALDWSTDSELAIDFAQDNGEGFSYDSRAVTFLDGELRLTSTGESYLVGGKSTDWAKGEFHDSGNESAWLVAVLGEKSPWLDTLPAQEVLVLSGAKARKDAADANLRVRATAVSANVRVEITVVDDVLVPVPADDKSLVRGDYVQVWLCGDESPCDRSRMRELGIGLLADGGIATRWLWPASVKEPLPHVTRDGLRLMLELPHSLLGFKAKAEEYDRPFSVVYADTDEAGKGTETVIATSRVKKGKPDSLGTLSRMDATLSRLPEWTEAEKLARDQDPIPAGRVHRFDDAILNDEVPPLLAASQAQELADGKSAREQHEVAKAANTRGFRLFRAGILDQATTMLEVAAKIDPSYGMPRYNLARIHATRGKTDQALRWLTELKALGPNQRRRLEEARKEVAFKPLWELPAFKALFVEP